MSFVSNAPYLQRNNPVSSQSGQQMSNNSAFILCKNYPIQPRSSQTLCQKRMFQAYSQQDVEDNLVKKVKNSYNSPSNIYNDSNQEFMPEVKLNFSSSQTLATDINISFNLGETVPLKHKDSVASELETTISDTPSDATSDVLLIPDTQEDRASYETFFKQMHDNLVVGFQRQLEFIQVMKKMNSPEFAMQFPSLDKINPMVAGMLKEKAKMDVKTVVVMKDAHKMLKNGPSKVNKKSLRRISGEQVENVVSQMMAYIKEGSL